MNADSIISDSGTPEDNRLAVATRTYVRID